MEICQFLPVSSIITFLFLTPANQNIGDPFRNTYIVNLTILKCLIPIFYIDSCLIRIPQGSNQPNQFSHNSVVFLVLFIIRATPIFIQRIAIASITANIYLAETI